MRPWEPYRPTADEPVGPRARSATCTAGPRSAPTWAELAAGVADGPDKTIDRTPRRRPGRPDFDRTSEYMASERSLPPGNAGDRSSPRGGSTACSTAPHPLREKLTLFWHNHFATSNAKVQNARLMLGQYELMHRHALGNFAELLQEMSHRPGHAGLARHAARARRASRTRTTPAS